MVPTLVTELSNIVVLIGASERLRETTKHSGMAACGAQILAADLRNATNVATEHRPFAIVVGKDTYEFGGAEFDALARDVGAELIVVPDAVQAPLLTTLIAEAASRLS
jgi:hypothetical protein